MSTTRRFSPSVRRSRSSTTSSPTTWSVMARSNALEGAFVEFAGHAERVLIGTTDEGSDRVAAMLAAPTWRFGTDAPDLRLVPRALGPEGSMADVRPSRWPHRDAAAPRSGVPQPAQRHRGNRCGRGSRRATGAGARGADGVLAASAAGSNARRRRRHHLRRRLRASPHRAASHACRRATGVSRSPPRRRLPAAPLFPHRCPRGGPRPGTRRRRPGRRVADVYGAREAPQPGVSGRWWPTPRWRPARWCCTRRSAPTSPPKCCRNCGPATSDHPRRRRRDEGRSRSARPARQPDDRPLGGRRGAGGGRGDCGGTRRAAPAAPRGVLPDPQRRSGR